MTHKLLYYAYQSFVWTMAAIFGISVVPGYAAQPSVLQISANRKTTIVLPTQAILSEETAAKELQHYLSEITGGDYPIVPEDQITALNGTRIYVGPTQFAKDHLQGKSTFNDEEWLLQTSGNALILDGGRPRGTLYAAYHFLEDVCGVHWWNPWEETVPRQKVLSIPALNKRGQPAFRYRDIFTIYGHDGGRFMARSRLNRQGDSPVDAAYGGTRNYGPPYHVHTFYMYISPEKYFAAHPDWFVGNGKKAPTVSNSQLAMSNPEMRKEFLKLLLENIRASRANAIAKHLPPPDVYDVSQNDNSVSFVGPGDEALVKKNGGAESAILLSFINYLADGIKSEFPDVYIDTLAYHTGEKAPTNMNARDNVIVRLTDTQSNVLLPVTAERNHVMRENIEDWAQHCKNLRVWDYDITYQVPHIPQPTMQTYSPDLQFFLNHNVEGMFIEFEKPLQSDMRDLKLWVLCKLLENPHQDYTALVREFTDGFYGPAGSYVRQYLAALETAASKSHADIDWFASLPKFNYLTLNFLQQADHIYQQAADVVKDNPVFSQRVRNARSSVDDAILLRYPVLMREWVQAGHTPESMPLKRDAVAKRFRQSWNEQIDLRLPESARASAHQKANDAIDMLTAGSAYVPLPTKFKDVPADYLFIYSARDMRNYLHRAKVVPDTESESGIATRYEIPDDLLEKYKLPMQWGLYDTVGKKINSSSLIKTTDIPAAGYHWYKMGDVTLTGHDYLYFFWSWIIQNDLNDAFDAQNPNAKYGVWADLKFEGPAFPFAKAGDKNAISVERIVLVKK